MDTVPCPACTADMPVFPDRTMLDCEYCGSRWARTGVSCPACGANTDPEQERCPECGEPLTTFSRVMERLDPMATRRRMERNRQMAQVLKGTAELASRRRMSEFEEIDRQREIAYRTARERQQQRERQILVTAAAISAVIIILVAVVAVLLTR